MGRLLIGLVIFAISLSAQGQIGRWEPLPGEQEKDREQMLVIWKALMAYVTDKGQEPDYLSDLFPKYLKDMEVLISPLSKRVGVVGGDASYRDPALPTSYCYEFNGQKIGEDTCRDLKHSQMQEFGEVVPILRCFLYGRVLNLSYGGNFYESDLYWESSREVKELMDKKGMGPGLAEGESVLVKIKDAATGKPISNADVQLTERVMYSLPLPDRTIKTDDDGAVQVPLGKATNRGRSVKVKVALPGYEPIAKRLSPGYADEPQVFELQPVKDTEKEKAAPVGAAF